MYDVIRVYYWVVVYQWLVNDCMPYKMIIFQNLLFAENDNGCYEYDHQGWLDGYKYLLTALLRINLSGV